MITVPLFLSRFKHFRIVQRSFLVHENSTSFLLTSIGSSSAGLRFKTTFQDHESVKEHIRQRQLKSQEANEMCDTFIAAFNPLTGRTEMKSAGKDHDFIQEIARSSYGDMLHDTERNKLYYRAIAKTVQHLKKQRTAEGGDGDGIRPLKVLDIGTGTGLLSMMAARSGADQVTACECFTPVAECAKKCIAANDLSGKIKVIGKRSDQLRMGVDMDEKADLLVAELYDTEMIGEGALPIYRHARRELLKDTALSVPSRGRIWAQLVASESLYGYHEIMTPPQSVIRNPANDGNICSQDPSQSSSFNCDLNGRQTSAHESAKSSSSALYHSFNETLHDVQLNRLKPGTDFIPVSDPQIIFDFDFLDVKTMPTRDVKIIDFPITADVTQPLVVFFWWDSPMDWEGEIILSCAPYWARSDYPTQESVPWRDHWMQAIYYIPDLVSHRPQRGDRFPLRCWRDDYSFKFEHGHPENELPAKCGTCSWCDIHRNLSRSRIAQLNEHDRLGEMMTVVNKDLSPTAKREHFEIKSVNGLNLDVICRPAKRKNFANPPTVLFLGSVSHLQVAALHHPHIGKFIIYAPDAKYDRLHSHFLSHFKPPLMDRAVITSNFNEISSTDIDYVITEPYFDDADLPWHSLHCAFLMSRMRHVRSDMFTSFPSALPKRALVKVLPVTFEHLWKIKAPLGKVEGFDVTPFDQLIQTAMDQSDSSIESQPLCDYVTTSCAAVADTIFMFDLTKHNVMSSRKHNYEIQISQNSCYSDKPLSLAFWIEFEYDGPKKVLSTGPIEPIEAGKPVVWYRNARQGVFFLGQPSSSTPAGTGTSNGTTQNVHHNYMIRYNARDGQLSIRPNRGSGSIIEAILDSPNPHVLVGLEDEDDDEELDQHI